MRFVVEELQRTLEAPASQGDVVHRLASGVRALYSLPDLPLTQAAHMTARKAVDRLRSGEAAGRGWGGTLGAPAGALLPTYHVLWALNLAFNSRVAPDHPDDERTRGLDFLALLAQNDGPARRFWSKSATSELPGYAFTALAVLSLAHSFRATDRELALQGARYLVETCDVWIPMQWEEVEEASVIAGFGSMYPTIAICPLACVIAWGRVDLGRLKSQQDRDLVEMLSSCVEKIDAMYRENRGGWQLRDNPPQVSVRRIMLSLEWTLARRRMDWDELIYRRRTTDSEQACFELRWDVAHGNLSVVDRSSGKETKDVRLAGFASEIIDALLRRPCGRWVPRAEILRDAGRAPSEPTRNESAKNYFRREVRKTNEVVNAALRAAGMATHTELLEFRLEKGTDELWGGRPAMARCNWPLPGSGEGGEH
jgi:hypothetical protein